MTSKLTVTLEYSIDHKPTQTREANDRLGEILSQLQKSSEHPLTDPDLPAAMKVVSYKVMNGGTGLTTKQVIRENEQLVGVEDGRARIAQENGSVKTMDTTCLHPEAGFDLSNAKAEEPDRNEILEQITDQIVERVMSRIGIGPNGEFNGRSSV